MALQIQKFAELSEIIKKKMKLQLMSSIKILKPSGIMMGLQPVKTINYIYRISSSLGYKIKLKRDSTARYITGNNEPDLIGQH